MYRYRYHTPPAFSDLLLGSDGQFLTDLWFADSPDDKRRSGVYQDEQLPIFAQTSQWLDEYFAGRQPEWEPPLALAGLTPFRREVVAIMKSIPFGQTRTYGEIAAIIARRQQRSQMSAQAVGGSVGWNPICLLIPCHRVVGAGGNLTGYGGGLDNKIALLRQEGIDTGQFHRPQRSPDD